MSHGGFLLRFMNFITLQKKNDFNRNHRAVKRHGRRWIKCYFIIKCLIQTQFCIAACYNTYYLALRLFFWFWRNSLGRPLRAVASGGGWGAQAPPVFDRSVKPISTGGGAHSPHPVQRALLDFQTLRRPCHFLFLSIKKIINYYFWLLNEVKHLKFVLRFIKNRFINCQLPFLAAKWSGVYKNLPKTDSHIFQLPFLAEKWSGVYEILNMSHFFWQQNRDIYKQT